MFLVADLGMFLYVFLFFCIVLEIIITDNILVLDIIYNNKQRTNSAWMMFVCFTDIIYGYMAANKAFLYQVKYKPLLICLPSKHNLNVTYKIVLIFL